MIGPLPPLLLRGDCMTELARIPDDSIDTVVTSPPYWGLRDYGHEDQLGSEATIEDYVDNLVAVMHQVHRVLKPTGVLWLNIGDTYAGRANAGPAYSGNHTLFGRDGKVPARKRTTHAARAKSLVGAPWRVALAMIDVGWILRSDVVWAKPNPMPESVRDRPTKSHEYVFMLTKSPRYFYNAEAVAEPVAPSTVARAGRGRESDYVPPGQKPQTIAQPKPARFGGSKYGDAGDGGSNDETRTKSGNAYAVPEAGTRNRRDVWTIAPGGFKGAHSAVMPLEIARICARASTPPGGVVLDPFAGSGTTLEAAYLEGFESIGVELTPDYWALIEARIERVAGNAEDNVA